jgi:hypothetical protein
MYSSAKLGCANVSLAKPMTVGVGDLACTGFVIDSPSKLGIESDSDSIIVIYLAGWNSTHRTNVAAIC